MEAWQERWLYGLCKKEEKEELKEENIKEDIIVEDREFKYNQPEPQSHICTNCKGNGYIKIDTIHGKDQIKQCWVCDSKGELEKYVQADVDKFIYDFYFRGV